MTVDIETLDLRTLQRECARALLTMDGTSAGISKFNKQAHHNSQLWYRAVIIHYCEEHGGFPSEIGPGVDIKLIMEE